MATKKKKKDSVPEQFVGLWKKDYYELTSEQRMAMVNCYLGLAQAYEMGTGDKINPPHFMTQEEVLKKEEEIKKTDEEQNKENELLRKKREWESKRVLVLSQVDRLKLEVCQLKLELADRVIKETNHKKDKIMEEQISIAKEIEKTHSVILDDYNLDLINGLCVRRGDVNFSGSL